MSKYDSWLNEGREYGWNMPTFSLWKRLPLIRHVFVLYTAVKIYRHESMWRAVGAIPSGYDHWVLYGLWHNYRRAP